MGVLVASGRIPLIQKFSLNEMFLAEVTATQLVGSILVVLGILLAQTARETMTVKVVD